MTTQLLLALLLALQSAETSTATLQGTVVRAGTNEGLSKTFVELYSADVGTLSDYDFNAAILDFLKGRQKTFTATTDAKGTFSISGFHLATTALPQNGMALPGRNSVNAA
jgi:hypothetical protein